MILYDSYYKASKARRVKFFSGQNNDLETWQSQSKEELSGHPCRSHHL